RQVGADACSMLAPARGVARVRRADVRVVAAQSRGSIGVGARVRTRDLSVDVVTPAREMPIEAQGAGMVGADADRRVTSGAGTRVRTRDLSETVPAPAREISVGAQSARVGL